MKTKYLSPKFLGATLAASMLTIGAAQAVSQDERRFTCQQDNRMASVTQTSDLFQTKTLIEFTTDDYRGNQNQPVEFENSAKNANDFIKYFEYEVAEQAAKRFCEDGHANITQNGLSLTIEP